VPLAAAHRRAPARGAAGPGTAHHRRRGPARRRRRPRGLALFRTAPRGRGRAGDGGSAGGERRRRPAVATVDAAQTPIIIETPDPPTAEANKDATKPRCSLRRRRRSPRPRTTPRAPSTVDRAPAVDPRAASTARVRPPGKPVPRVGEDPALAATTASARRGRRTRRPRTHRPTAATANVTSCRRRSRRATRQRAAAGDDRRVRQRLDPRRLQGSFFERNVCMDQRCEEARFRSTPECVDVLDRKRKRLSQ
jgi:hypothetical protein